LGFESRISIFLTIVGLATLRVGLFPENVRPWHGIVTLVSLLFGGLSAIASYRLQKPLLSYVSIVLGTLSLAAGILFNPYIGLPRESTTTYLGLDKGAMERMVIYPILLWIIGFGSQLAGSIKKINGFYASSLCFSRQHGSMRFPKALS